MIKKIEIIQRTMVAYFRGERSYFNINADSLFQFITTIPTEEECDVLIKRIKGSRKTPGKRSTK